jgi:ABC-type multidrug transport system fused ATPase/permease subunit
MNIPLRQYSDLLVGYLRPQWPRVLLLAVLLLGSTALPLANPLILRRFIDSAVDGEPTRTLVILAALFIGVALATQAVQVATTYVAETVGWTATNLLRADLVRHALRLDMPFHHTHTPGEMIERIDGDVTALTTFFSQFLLHIFSSVLLLTGVLIVLGVENLLVGGVMTVFTVTALVLLVRIRNLAVRQTTAERESSAQLFGFLEERLQGIDDIRTNGAGLYVMRRFYEKGRELYDSAFAAQKVSAWIWMSTMGVFALGYALALGLGAGLYLRGAITIGTVYLFFQYMQMLRRPLELIAEQLKQFQAASAGVGRVHELRRFRSAIVDASAVVAPTAHNLHRQASALESTAAVNGHAGLGDRLPGVAGADALDRNPTTAALSVEFDAVTFSYHDGEPVLSDISFAVRPGHVLGVLGRTGSGKTTLTRLLLRLYEAEQGAVRIGGVDVREIPTAELRRRVGVVTQDVQLFAASVRDNLTLFDDSVPDERIMAVLADLGLLDWFFSLPHGLETDLQSGGGGLSAGEAQLLAFARVFLKGPGLVILDEASSRLDPATERLIERAVDRLLAGRTGLIIAHRLGTVQRADDILILDNGRIREHGPRDSLARDDTSRFAELLRTGMEQVLV